MLLIEGTCFPSHFTFHFSQGLTQTEKTAIVSPTWAAKSKMYMLWIHPKLLLGSGEISLSSAAGCSYS